MQRTLTNATAYELADLAKTVRQLPSKDDCECRLAEKVLALLLEEPASEVVERVPKATSASAVRAGAIPGRVVP